MSSKDATTTLAEAHQHAGLAVGPPEPGDPCDRCERPILNGPYQLSHGHRYGDKSVWWICGLCDAQLSLWMLEPRGLTEIGGTGIVDPSLETS